MNYGMSDQHDEVGMKDCLMKSRDLYMGMLNFRRD